MREAYENKYGRSLAKRIEKKFYGKMEDGLLSLLYDPIENFARGLKAACHGLGTDKVRSAPPPERVFFSRLSVVLGEALQYVHPSERAPTLLVPLFRRGNIDERLIEGSSRHRASSMAPSTHPLTQISRRSASLPEKYFSVRTQPPCAFAPTRFSVPEE